MFEVFFAQEWVQVATAFAFVIVISLTPYIYWRISRILEGDTRKQFIEAATDIYIVVFFLLIAPIGYLILYFLGSKSNFMLNDPMAWVCFIGGLASVFDLIRAQLTLKSITLSRCCSRTINAILFLKKTIRTALFFSPIPLLYGLVLIGVTNLIPPDSINPMLWFLTFMVTAIAIAQTVSSKALLLVSQKYASKF